MDASNVTPLPVAAKPAVERVEIDAVDRARAEHVAAIRNIDRGYAEALAAELKAIEATCQRIVATTLSQPTLPVGVIEEARQQAAEAADRAMRINKLMNPMGGA